MLLSKEVEILITKKNQKYYEKLGYTPIIGDEITIPIEEMPLNSHKIVKVKCDYCDNKNDISYKSYNKNIKKNNKYACSPKCSYKKKSEMLLKEEGIENIFQSEKVKEKIKSKNIQKWGVDHYSKTDEFKDKYKKTSFEKWGVYNVMKLDAVKLKAKETNIEKWGGVGFESSEILDKIKATNIKKWGTD